MKLEEFISYEQPTNYIVHSDQYTEDGQTPVLTAGQSFVLGYTDEEDGIYNGEPVVIFDDFTTSVQYVDFPFKVKSSAMKILKNKANANIKFCYYLLSWFQEMPPNHKRQWISTTSQIDINLPSLTEQEAIVKKIEAVSNIIKHRNEELSELDNLIKARFVELFGDITTGNYKYDTRKLGEVANVGSSHRVFTTEFVESGIPFYRGTEIGELANGIKPSEPYYIAEEHYYRLANDDTKPQVGDLLMPSICNKGQVWMVDTEEPFYYKDGRVLCISPDREIFDTKYLEYFMRAKTLVEYPKLGSGSTFAEFKIFLLKDIDVLIPPRDIQEQFADFVKQVDKSKIVVQKALEETQTLFDSLMQKYFG